MEVTHKKNFSHGGNCASRWENDCDCGLDENLQFLFDAANRSLRLLEKGASGWGVSKDLLRSAIARFNR